MALQYLYSFRSLYRYHMSRFPSRDKLKRMEMVVDVTGSPNPESAQVGT